MDLGRRALAHRGTVAAAADRRLAAPTETVVARRRRLALRKSGLHRLEAVGQFGRRRAAAQRRDVVDASLPDLVGDIGAAVGGVDAQ